MTNYLYVPADEIRPGDIITSMSRFPVESITRLPADHFYPAETIRFTFERTEFTRSTSYSGPFGWEWFNIQRPSGGAK